MGQTRPHISRIVNRWPAWAIPGKITVHGQLAIGCQGDEGGGDIICRFDLSLKNCRLAQLIFVSGTVFYHKIAAKNCRMISRCAGVSRVEPSAAAAVKIAVAIAMIFVFVMPASSRLNYAQQFEHSHRTSFVNSSNPTACRCSQESNTSPCNSTFEHGCKWQYLPGTCHTVPSGCRSCRRFTGFIATLVQTCPTGQQIRGTSKLCL